MTCREPKAHLLRQKTMLRLNQSSSEAIGISCLDKHGEQTRDTKKIISLYTRHDGSGRVRRRLEGD